MKLRLLFLLAVSATLHAAARRDHNRVIAPDSDGGVIVEFASPVSIQYERWWGAEQPTLGAPLTLTTQSLTLEDRDSTVHFSSSFLDVTITGGAITVLTKSGREVASMPKPATRTGFQLKAEANEQFYGLGAIESTIESKTLNLRGQVIKSTRPLLLSSRNYGLFIPSGRATFDLTKPDVISIESDHPKFQLYYGRNPKEILEQHAVVTHAQVDLPESALSNRDKSKLAKEIEHIEITESSYCDSPRILNELALSGVVFPAIDLAKIGKYEQSIQLLPFLYDSRSSPHTELEQRRGPWDFYLIAYLREAHDRGLPFIRPLLMQFPLDKGLDTHSDVYMIGDEILVAPGCNVTEVDLPRGSWTDLRNNANHQGHQKIANDPKAGLPIYAKSGSLLPLKSTRAGIDLELHYFPTLGAEFFVYEPDVNEYSQFHAAPSADFMRVESESKVARTCEWILHHTPKPKTVGETGKPFRQVASHDALKPGAWFHDAKSGNLHILIATAAGEDHIVNMSF